jgi:hypothetical protein
MTALGPEDENITYGGWKTTPVVQEFALGET